jgi:uncharacterized membrane protein
MGKYEKTVLLRWCWTLFASLYFGWRVIFPDHGPSGPTGFAGHGTTMFTLVLVAFLLFAIRVHRREGVLRDERDLAIQAAANRISMRAFVVLLVVAIQTVAFGMIGDPGTSTIPLRAAKLWVVHAMVASLMTYWWIEASMALWLYRRDRRAGEVA